MTWERQIKRTIYEAKCQCGWADILERNPPREVLCPECREWCKYEEVSYTGPDFKR